MIYPKEFIELFNLGFNLMTIVARINSKECNFTNFYQNTEIWTL
jgi:hypothetical protein